MSGVWTYVLSRRAQRDMRSLNAQDRFRVLDALDRLVSQPPAGDIRKLQGKQDEWRLRVDPWQILFVPDYERRQVLVRRVRNRSDAYRRS